MDVVHKKAHKGITEGRASLTVVIDRNGLSFSLLLP